MEIVLDPELERALLEESRRQGQSPEILARIALRERFLGLASPPKPRDDWERKLLGASRDCGVSLPPSALTGDEIYD